ncbi:MAG TPA: hypothetical protein VN257_04455 [Actinotalea sp.]|nr:hypothetical protein [Actinotalea sp.]
MPRPAAVVLRALLAVATGLGGLLLAGVAPAAADEADVSTPLVFIGVGGLRWDDVSTLGTPALWTMSRDAAVGLLAARSVAGAACPADGWLAVSAGTRLADQKVEDGTCRTLREPGVDGLTPGWQDYLEAAERQSYDAQPGLLGELLATAGTAVTGIGPGAAIALSDPSGTPVGTHERRPTAAGDLTGLVRDALQTSDLVVVDAGTVRDQGYATRPRGEGELEPEPELEPSDPGIEDPDLIVEPTRAEQAHEIDARVDAVLRATRGRDVTVMLVSLADSGRARLQLVAATGPGTGGSQPYEQSMVTSGSTRQLAVVQAVDLTPTVLAAVGLAGASPALVGAEIVATPGPDTATGRQALVTSIAAESTQVIRVSGGYMTRLVLTQALLFLAAAIVLTRTGRSDRPPLRPALRGLRVAAVALAAAPISSFLTGLVPWWLAPSPGAAFWAVLLGWVAALTALAVLGPWRRELLGPIAVVAAATVIVLVLDMLTGSHLVIDSPMGAHRVLAARFYGLSNQAFAMLTSAGLLLAAVVADVLLRRGRRRLATAAVAAIGVLLVVVDGAPGLGSDFGGPPALVVSFALLTLVVSGRKVSWRTLLIIGVAAAVVVGAFMVLDWLRAPDDRTHLGRFFATMLDGGLWDVLYRKLSVNLRVLTSWRYLLLAFGGAAITALVLVGPNPRRSGLLGRGSPLAGLQEAVPLLRPTIAAIGLALTVGYFINDSGIVVPATGIAVAVPLLVAAAAQWRLGSPAPTSSLVEEPAAR